MSAVQYVTLGDFVENVLFQATVSVDLDELASEIYDYKITHPDIMSLEFTQPMLNQMLRLLTGCVWGVQSDLNCYPLGYVSTLLFDADGHLVP
jgi:hypothetical protein